MRPVDYLRILRRRWWIPLLAALIATMSAYGFSRFVQERLYRSEASYLVVPNRLDNGLLIVLRGRMNSYRVAALAPDQLEKISADLKLDRSADWMLRHVAIQPLPEETLMVIQVDYPEPDVAPRIADAIGANMAALIAQQNTTIEGTDRINVRVNQRARAPFLYRPQTRTNMLAGALLGLVLGTLLAFVRDAIDDTLKTADDVERFVALTTLGAIPTADR